MLALNEKKMKVGKSKRRMSEGGFKETLVTGENCHSDQNGKRKIHETKKIFRP